MTLNLQKSRDQKKSIQKQVINNLLKKLTMFAYKNGIYCDLTIYPSIFYPIDKGTGQIATDEYDNPRIRSEKDDYIIEFSTISERNKKTYFSRNKIYNVNKAKDMQYVNNTKNEKNNAIFKNYEFDFIDTKIEHDKNGNEIIMKSKDQYERIMKEYFSARPTKFLPVDSSDKTKKKGKRAVNKENKIDEYDYYYSDDEFGEKSFNKTETETRIENNEKKNEENINEEFDEFNEFVEFNNCVENGHFEEEENNYNNKNNNTQTEEPTHEIKNEESLSDIDFKMEIYSKSAKKEETKKREIKVIDEAPPKKKVKTEKPKQKSDINSVEKKIHIKTDW